jgi:hypothetical protein
MTASLLPPVKVYDHCEIEGKLNTITCENFMWFSLSTIKLVGKKLGPDWYPLPLPPFCNCCFDKDMNILNALYYYHILYLKILGLT